MVLILAQEVSVFWIRNLIDHWMNHKRREQEEALRRAILAEEREELWNVYFTELGQRRINRDFN
jgi:hypothetical protein